MRTGRSYPESRTVLGLDDLEDVVDSGLDAPGFPAQPAQRAEALHPLGLGGDRPACQARELFLQRLGHQRFERLAAFGRSRLRPPEQGVGNLDRRLHRTILPYLRFTPWV